MKLSRRRLRNLIIEEIENLNYEYKKTSGQIKNHKHPSEVKARENSWAGGENIYHQVDHLKTGGSKEKSVRGIERLKIVESRRLQSLIRRIIQENLEDLSDKEKISIQLAAQAGSTSDGLAAPVYHGENEFNNLADELVSKVSDDYDIEQLIADIDSGRYNAKIQRYVQIRLPKDDLRPSMTDDMDMNMSDEDLDDDITLMEPDMPTSELLDDLEDEDEYEEDFDPADIPA